MKGGLGIVAVLAVAFSLRPGQAPTRQEAAPVAPSTVAPAAPTVGVGAKLLRQHFGPSEASPMPAGASASPAQFLIATIPDPLASHLDWAYDSHLDAIRRAFERAGYVLDRFELPWVRDDERVPTMPGVPGAVLFRRAASWSAESGGDGRPWLVYLVSELSTGGIDRGAFAKALAERRVLLGQDPISVGPVLVVGPVFSGSAPSLSSALAGAGTCRVITGSATSPRNEATLERDGLEFLSTLHTDAALLGVLQGRVLAGLNCKSTEVAVLKESTTDYGQAASTGGSDAWWSIPFPMSIGTLRTAFREEAAPGSSVPSPRGLRSSVDFDLSAEPRRAETAFTASKLTPASIDRLLEEITRSLAERNIRAVVILASDVRDKLFLGAELKKRLPDLQLATTEGNLLYLRPDYNRWLRGMVVVSTYPLTLRNSRGRAQSSTRNEQLMFPNEGAEGTFNAVLRQLERPDLMTDYAPPFLEAPAGVDPLTVEERPPVWVSVVGDATMLPLSVVQPGQVPDSTPVAVATKTPFARGESHRSGSTLLAQLGIAAASLLFLSLIIVQAKADCTGRGLSVRILRALPRRTETCWRERQDDLERVSLALHHELYLTFLYASIWCLLLPNVLLVALPRQWSEKSLVFTGVLGCTAVVLGAAAILLRAWFAARIIAEHGKPAWQHLREREGWPSTRLRVEWFLEGGFRALVVGCALLYLGWTLALCFQIAVLAEGPVDPSYFALFFERAIAIDQGVSPLVPLALIGAISVAWSCWHLARIRGLAVRVPGEAILHRPPTPRASAKFLASETRQRLFRVVPTTAGFAWILAVIAAGATLAVRFEKTLDGSVLDPEAQRSAFDCLLCIGILGALGGSIWAGYRLISVWQAFREDLHGNEVLLASLPFAAIHERLGVRADLGLWPGGHVRNLPQIARPAWLRLAENPDEIPARLRTSLDPAELARVARRRERLRLEADPVAVRNLAVLVESLRKDPLPGKPDAKPSEDPALRARQRWRASAGEVVALELLSYVEWVFGQLRRLSFFLLLSLVLITLLISSYPYQPQHLVQTLSLLVFAAMVVGLVGLIGAISRNAQLSSMSVAPAGEVTWDRTMFANLALYALLPLITLISSQYSGLRESLFDWVKPLVTFLVKA